MISSALAFLLAHLRLLLRLFVFVLLAEWFLAAQSACQSK